MYTYLPSIDLSTIFRQTMYEIIPEIRAKEVHDMVME